MPSCQACGAELASAAPGSPCAKCGAASAAGGGGLELDLPKRGAKAPVAAGSPRARPPEVELKLELAIDPRSLIQTATSGPGPGLPVRRSPSAAALAAAVGDVAFDARLLAEYGDAPRHWIFAPLYAWRVLRRQRELKKALLGRREEVKRARTEADDARVAFAERVRHDAEKHEAFAGVLGKLRAAEEVLRSRDEILASEQDAQTARLASVDARLARLESEVAQAQAAERAISGELASAQAALARGETKLKRAESELRAAQQREADEARA